jgi:hypothetical protein
LLTSAQPTKSTLEPGSSPRKGGAWGAGFPQGTKVGFAPSSKPYFLVSCGNPGGSPLSWAKSPPSVAEQHPRPVGRAGGTGPRRGSCGHWRRRSPWSLSGRSGWRRTGPATAGAAPSPPDSSGGSPPIPAGPLLKHPPPPLASDPRPCPPTLLLLLVFPRLAAIFPSPYPGRCTT